MSDHLDLIDFLFSLAIAMVGTFLIAALALPPL